MEHIFKALSDPTRRELLDALRRRDGQTLTELEASLAMSRFGVMKHLKLLEDANLIVTRKSGRFKHHYLNALPLQDVMDRWVAPFLQPQAKALSDLKAKLEKDTSMSKPDFMMQTFIRCTQDALWDALTQADDMARYHFACNTVQGNAAVGGETTFILPHGEAMLRQVTTALDPKSKIAMTFEPLFMGPDAPPSHMVYLIEPQGDTCKLTIEHYDMAPGQDGFAEGWARLAASLKSFLETGEPLKAVM
ncbi:metalloregulator ArsR/SmtB family transcription factor [Octadecabacter sp. 1_MG-2023]|uniref:ArsR/SmtB family transcription factor n=1 Tax=unclassified Octadecabacter TaxID=196158 RepID=UPI001C0834AF|nr:MULTISPECIES: metalloregulator ArsR/SmtB family transcription factor [unclassified Octadecabacter]MBU2992826.1 metalloregulator ArsR/SmtB family transcription factor [Octadecabacter sp. B2R22]MDO6733723.1 metalloregulator ArsR/SmtB family transcription factor [Octadecabacter sp. 1_MG-2023]